MRERPLVIAHRGASGYLPEHTLAAKALAHEQGADFLEQDVVATGDGQLIVCHDIFLDRITNVREVYSQRARADGLHYVIDFGWSEIRELKILQQKPESSAQRKSPTLSSQSLRLCSLEEEIQFIHKLNRESGRNAGVFPEIKKPGWHAEHGFDVSSALLELLARYGYEGPEHSIFVQCFDADELRRIKSELGSGLKLLQLVGRSTASELLQPRGLAAVAEYAVALGPNYRQLIEPTDGAGIVATQLAQDARAAGLQLHPYTFNRDNLPGYANELEELLEIFCDAVDPEAVFCDHPDIAIAVRAKLNPARGG